MTPQPAFDLTPFLGRDEGQHFDRKSMIEGAAGQKRQRDRRAAYRKNKAPAPGTKGTQSHPLG